jgi:uncharacterized protein
MRPSRFLLYVALASAALPAFSQTYPPPKGYVNDYADVISGSDEAAVATLVRDVLDSTSVEIAVAVMSDLGGIDIETYAVELFEAWGVGYKGADNGVLLLVGLEERKVRIEVGYGLEGMLPDGRVGTIIRREILPHFRNEDYSSGVRAGVESLAAIILAEYDGQVVSRDTGQAADELPWWAWLIIMIVGGYLFIKHPWLIFALMLGGRARGGRWGGRGGFGGFGGGTSGGGGATGGW